MSPKMPKKIKIDQLPPSPNALKVTKKQAAASQIATAVRLFFFEEDLISALVLAGAARDVLRGLAKARGVKTMFESAKDIIREEYQGAFFDIMHDSYNFLKHGSRDPDKTYDRFSPDEVALTIFQACADFKAVFQEVYFEQAIFMGWMICRNPKLLHDEYHPALHAAQLALNITSDTPFKESIVEFADILRLIDKDPSEVESRLKLKLLRDTYSVEVPHDYVTVLIKRPTAS